MKIYACSYNIHSGKNILYRPTLDKMIDFFYRNPVDILAVQEIHNNTKVGKQVDKIQHALGMEVAFAENVSIDDGFYGNAIFSRFPIVKNKNIKLTSNKEQRGALYVQLDIAGHLVTVINTHLGLGKKERTIQLKEVEDLIPSDPSPTLLLGDLNTTSPLSFNQLMDLGKKAGKEGISTIFPLRKRIDFIFSSPSLQLIDYEVIPVDYSDHYPIRASLLFCQ